jgi:hypothetical protein
MNKPFFLTALSCVVAVSASGGDWGKVPVSDKTPVAPIEECVDLGASIEIGYHTNYIFKGYEFGDDTVIADVRYTYDGLGLPLSFGIRHANMTRGNAFVNIVNDETALSSVLGLPTVAGINSSLSYTYRFYTEDPSIALYPSSHGEFGLHLRRDVNVALLKFDLFYNPSLPNAWNGTLAALPTNDRGAWFWDLGAEREFDVMGQSLVLEGGVAYADNYWGTAPNFQTGGRSSGWNHYYLRASVPIQLNCRAELTPYVGYVGAPDSWLLDGAPEWASLQGKSDILHGGVNLKVSF